MINLIKTKLIALKDAIKGEMDEMGGVHIFLMTCVIFLIVLPFLLAYYLLLQPAYKIIRMLVETPKLGLKYSYKKQFYSDEYEKEKEEKEKKNNKAPLLPDGIFKKFEDMEDWPDAYVVDGNAILAAEGRILLYVDEDVKEFLVPDGVVNIYHRCFVNCHRLEKIRLSSTVRRIGKRAFKNCISLREIAIPESVNSIGEEVFMNCSSLREVKLSSQIEEIPSRSFAGCKSLHEIIMPDKAKRIGKEAFRRCYSLEHIKLNEQLENIGEKAFEDCHELKELIMPETVKSVSVGEFNGCHSLEHIHFSAQIKDFGGSCCRECWNVKRISMTPFDDKEKEFFKKQWEKYADEVDISLSEKPYPESRFWTTDDTLYYGVPRLTSVCLVFCFSKNQEYTIPSFVTNIKREAFSSCQSLRKLRLSPYIKASDDPWEHKNISYDFIYEFWPQVEEVLFDETLKNTKYAFGLIG